jgi:hypothetical protein
MRRLVALPGEEARVGVARTPERPLRRVRLGDPRTPIFIAHTLAPRVRPDVRTPRRLAVGTDGGHRRRSLVRFGALLSRRREGIGHSGQGLATGGG